MFEVRFTTTSYAPPRVVTILTPGNNWQGIQGAYVDGSWVFSLDETSLWNGQSYFKFVLDDRFWMDDPYFQIGATAGSTYSFDETSVAFPAHALTAAVPAEPAPAATPAPAAAAADPEPPAIASPPTVLRSLAAVSPTSVTAVNPAALATPGGQAVITQSTPTPAVVATVPVVGPVSLPVAAAPSLVDFGLPVSEGAVTNRVVLLATPFITAGAAWVAGVIARHVPGVTLDQTQIVSFMIAIVAVCLAGAWKWLQGWQQHELLVAQKLASAIKPVIGNLPREGKG